jgi:pyridoxal phosphate enzyme (YggS family)
MTYPSISDRLKAVRERIGIATVKSGRKEGAVKLVAVSKTESSARIEEAFQAGQVDFGENYMQEALAKIPFFKRRESPICWHFMGQLQSNKVKLLWQNGSPIFGLIHSLDRLKVAREIEKLSKKTDKRQPQPVLLQVNLAREASKGGWEEDDLLQAFGALLELPSISILGLMVIPPLAYDQGELHRFYGRARLLKEKIVHEFPTTTPFCELSMGMSSDYEIAILEGATMVRVGTAIFGPRT